MLTGTLVLECMGVVVWTCQSCGQLKLHRDWYHETQLTSLTVPIPTTTLAKCLVSNVDKHLAIDELRIWRWIPVHIWPPFSMCGMSTRWSR